jgi:hypothetical protein
MNLEVKKDMSWSACLFAEQVFPIISESLGGGSLILMEGRPDIELAKMLDMQAGIDGWHIKENGALRGIASRVQKGDKAWNTFTIRKERDSGHETEFAKRKRAIESDGAEIYPHLTVQAYATTENGPVTSVGVCRTKDIIEFIETKKPRTRRTSNAEFFVCPWADMQQNGYKVKIIELKKCIDTKTTTA